MWQNNDKNKLKNMKYKDAVYQSMNMLAEDPKSLFVGYGLKYGKALNTLKDIAEKSPEKIIETPLAENLMMSMSIGLSIEGYKPLVYFERFNFILIALDSIVNHLDMFRDISDFEYRPKVIIRATVGRKLTPFLTGPTHTADFTEAMKKLVKFPVLKPSTSSEVLEAYKFAYQYPDSVMIIEDADILDIDF